jgi:hypothetical protein
MTTQTDGQSNVQQAFDNALRLQCGIAGIVSQGTGNNLMIVNPATGTQVTVTYKSAHIFLLQSNWGTSYIEYVPSAEGVKLRIRNNPDLMFADDAAKHLMERLLKEEKL